ncbi:MAG: hypothetical protein WAM91_17470 [Candidatus Acidiferrales bacterium]
MSHKPKINEQTRCTYRTANGRRCQMPFAPNHTALCAQHALQELQLHDSKIVTEEILGPLGDFRSAFAVNRALGKLFALTAENRIPVRNALALAYIGQLMIQTLHPIKEETTEMGWGGRIHYIIHDAVDRLGDEVPKIPHLTVQAPKPTLRENVEDALAILKNAGFNLPPEIIHKFGLDDDGGGAAAADEENGDDDADNGDDDDATCDADASGQVARQVVGR